MKVKYIVLVTAFLCLGASAQQTNVLLIIADDLGIDSLAAFNNDPTASLPPTPTIDNIQSNGITFTRYYSYSTCSPTRSAILTGRYAYRTGVYSPQDNNLMANEFTLPDALIGSGVISNRLAQVGKWHLGNDANSPKSIGGWPHFSGALGGGLPDFYSWQKTVNGTTINAYSVYATTDNVNDAEAWIDAQGTNSWFLWLAFNAPHTPLQRPPNDLHDYDGITDDGEDDSRPHFEAMVQAMDTEIARLLNSVDLSETTVIFMGDNGTARNVLQPPFPNGRRGHHGKGTAYEGGIRVPLLICGAAVSNGLENTVYDGALHSVDLYGTILELFGVDIADVVPEELVYDSRSFFDVLGGNAYARDPAEIMVDNAFGINSAQSIMEGDFKYIGFTNGTEELYNVTLDLPESVNLLSGTLTPIEQTAYESLTNRLATYINTPQLYSGYLDGSGGFNVEIGWFDNEGFTLYRTDHLVSNDWNIVAGQEFEDNGTAALILRDPVPPGSNAFYRVTTP
ncbi:sulfatase-like hydrolase/transferase [Pontiellaceae bacterium B12227]|nr:sulfatase-like hydrolase/transferase [Pontiellaceae bacterium B12227]